jgi:prophage antirepressor-like protein
VSTELQVRSFRNVDVRIATRPEDGEPGVCGDDFARLLGYSNPRDAIKRHVPARHRFTVVIHDGTPGNPNRTFITEPGANLLVMGSDQAEALEVKHWLAEDVMPSIRKTGGYTISPLPAAPVPWVVRCNEEHAVAARVHVNGARAELIRSGRRRHDKGRTYVTAYPIEGLLYSGYSNCELPHSLMKRLMTAHEINGVATHPSHILRIITGGESREYEIHDKLAPHRVNDGVDFFEMNEESLSIINDYRWAPGFQAVVDDWMKWRLITRRTALAITDGVSLNGEQVLKAIDDRKLSVIHNQTFVL